MAFDSFRDFLARLETAGELRRITQPLATELEITEIADREMKKPGGGQALLVEKPTVNGQVSPFPLAINTLGSYRRMALSLGADSIDEAAAGLGSLVKAKPPTSFKEAISLLGTALDLRHAKPKQVKDGPCKEVVHKFDAPPTRTEPWPEAPDILKAGQAARPAQPSTESRDRRDACPTLLNLPIQQCWPLDGGRFITLPCVVTRDPDTGERNVGMYRMQVYDDRTTGMHWQLQKVGARHGRRYYETGTRMPVAVFLGGDPVFTFCATAPLPDGLDEFLLAGYLRKKSVELVRCETSDLEVPANADIVIEGYVDPQRTAARGRAVRRPHRLLFAARPLPGLSPHRDHASQGRRLSGDDRGRAADGGLLHRQRLGEAVPADTEDDFPGIGGPGAAGRRRVPQPRVREHQEDLPDAGLQGHARPLGHGADDVHQVYRGRGR